MKAQVTMFIVLGILIVALVGTVFFFSDYILKNKFEREASKVQVSDQMRPVYDYLVTCIEGVSDDGIKLIAMQAGFLEVPPYKYIINPLNPFSNKLDVFGNNAMEVPYWFYETDNGIQYYNVPSLNQIQDNLALYIKNNVGDCLDNFTLFYNYDVGGFDNIEPEVTITEDKIYIKVLSDVTVDYKGVSQDFDRFYVTLDYNFGKLYNIAREILNVESEESFFEEKTIDMLVLYEELPFSFTEFNCNERIWSRQQVLNDFKNIVNLNTMKYNLDDNNYFSLDIKDKGMDATFYYSTSWPFYLDVEPSKGDILKGESIIKKTGITGFLSSLLCINDYHFVYNVKYPLLVKLGDGELDFFFAFESIIKNNNPKTKILTESLGFEEGVDLCDNKISNLDVETFTVDQTGNLIPLDGVDISFKCFNTICYIGKTYGYNLIDAIPQCLNGLIIGEKEDYYKGESLVSSNLDVDTDLVLEPLYDLNVEVKLIKDGNIFDVDDEDVIINFESGGGYETSINYGVSKNVKLIADNYKINGYVSKEGKVYIEKDVVKDCVSVPREGILGLVFSKEKCFETEIGGFELNNVIVGGNEFEFEFDRTSLINNDKITIYLNVKDIPKTYEEVVSLYDNIEGGSLSAEFKYPEFK